MTLCTERHKMKWLLKAHQLTKESHTPPLTHIYEIQSFIRIIATARYDCKAKQCGRTLHRFEILRNININKVSLCSKFEIL